MANFSYEPFYQLLRMTLIAKMTTPTKIGDYQIEGYRIIHLSHSENTGLNILTSNHLKYSPGLKKYEGHLLHETWMDLLTDEEKPIIYWVIGTKHYQCYQIIRTRSTLLIDMNKENQAPIPLEMIRDKYGTSEVELK